MTVSILEQFRKSYQDLDNFPLLTAEAIADFRVEYGNDTLARLEQVIEDAPTNGKVIFAGHRGCGKSTLLAKFANQMRQQGYFVAFFPIGDLVELSDVNHVNILYSIALMLLKAATERSVKIPRATIELLQNWFTTTETQTITNDLKSELGAGGDFFKILTAKLRNESTFRNEIKKTYERRVSELAKKADEIATAIQTVTQKQVLVIIDDLDKLDLSLVEDIYKNNINSLFLPKFRIIFTIPISAIRNSELMAVLGTATSDRIKLMEVCKFFKYGESHNPNAVPKEAAVKLFLEVLQKRIPDELIEADVASKIVLKSGGVIREVIRIARECCSQCLLQLRQNPEAPIKIDDEILNLALRDLRNDYSRLLGLDLYNLLAETYRNLKPQDAQSPNFLLLLHLLYVLEYENDRLWYDIHPIVVDLLKRENLIE